MATSRSHYFSNQVKNSQKDGPGTLEESNVNGTVATGQSQGISDYDTERNAQELPPYTRNHIAGLSTAHKSLDTRLASLEKSHAENNTALSSDVGSRRMAKRMAAAAMGMSALATLLALAGIVTGAVALRNHNGFDD
ncbi:Uu.00g113380.m01.CDS01 [Anthostomella pinea]|uniref:Uu.00g113380.m01.CDS01 n=1 Tax=Anthostomella pinea TaxID=933095 RepID=A0AAI8YGJ0_9PEZI|nr:Uu.00g113380.m01.CDS01 [Anthostomella pinea]